MKLSNDLAALLRRGDVPDLTDDATAGCLLLMLSRSTPKLVSAIETADGWTVDVHNRVEEHGDTLGEACAAALLALWFGVWRDQ